MGNLLKLNVFLKLSGLTVVLGSLFFGSAMAGPNHTFTTELQEVRTSSINGKEYLTIYIDSDVGPANCQGNVLRVDTQSMSQPGKQQAMESIALEAMLTSERVVITVPLTWDQCVDGMPTLTDINLVNRIQ